MNNAQTVKYIVILFVTFLFCSTNVFSQSLELSRKDKPDKIKIIGSSKYLEINLMSQEDPENTDLKLYRTYNGYFQQGNNESIKIKYDYSVIDRNNQETGFEKIESEEIYGNILNEQEIKLADIDYIIHHKKCERFFNISGSVALVGLVISPLFGMYFDDRKELRMNAETYAGYAGFFAVVAGISFSASKVFGRKKFYINPDYEGDENVWKINVK